MPKLGKTWFILSADYAYGKALVEGVTRSVTEAGGKVVGTVFHPFGASDMSSFMLQAQASKAEVIALGDAGPDMTNAIKAANEFGLIASGVKVVPLSMDLQAIAGAGGLQATQGMIMSLPWYRDANPPKSEAFADEFEKRQGMMAPYLMAGLYSAVRTYLLAAQATGSDDPKKIFPWMQQQVIDDAFTKHGVLRPDGRMVHDVYLVQVKTPAELKGPRDLGEAARGHSGRQGVPAHGSGRLPAGRERRQINGLMPLTDDVLLRTEAVTKSFSGFVAVKGVSLDVKRGAIHALIGPNGAGKTTYFNLLTRFMPVTSGRIFFKGRDITRAKPYDVARMGIVRSFQISAVFPHLTALENVRIALQRFRARQLFFLALRRRC